MFGLLAIRKSIADPVRVNIEALSEITSRKNKKLPFFSKRHNGGDKILSSLFSISCNSGNLPGLGFSEDKKSYWYILVYILYFAFLTMHRYTLRHKSAGKATHGSAGHQTGIRVTRLGTADII